MHWAAVKHLLHSLRGSIRLALTFAPDHSAESFQTWANADHGGNPKMLNLLLGSLPELGREL